MPFNLFVFYWTADNDEIGHSKTNPGEAALVVDIVRTFLLEGDLTRTDIGIISPYAGQVKLLHELFSREAIFTTATARYCFDSLSAFLVI